MSKQEQKTRREILRKIMLRLAAGPSPSRGGLSVVMASINPHRLRLPGSLESTLAIKIQSSAISDKHVLVKSLIPCHKPSHKFGADATTLIVWKHEHVGVVNDQITIRDGVAKPD
jgi:hypothetical protein